MRENEAIEYFYRKMECGDIKNDTEQLVYEETISVLEEIQKYRALGTVEELREAIEKQRAKKGISKKGFAIIHNERPTCGYNLFGNIPSAYCPNCGQYIDWSEVEE